MTNSRDRTHTRCLDPTRACPLCKRWDSSEIDRLRDMAGRKTILEIVTALNQEFKGLRPPRNYNAVVIAARRHGIDLVLTNALSIRQIERILHADHRMIRRWIDEGLLVARQFRAETRGSAWAIEREDLRRFIEQHSYAYDWTVMPAGRWRTLAETAARRMRWRTRDELMAYLGYMSKRFWKDHHTWIPHRRRWHNSAPSGSVLIRADDFAMIAAEIRRLEHEHNQAGLDRRRARARTNSHREWQRSFGCGWSAHREWAIAPPRTCPQCGELLLSGRRTRRSRAQAAGRTHACATPAGFSAASDCDSHPNSTSGGSRS